MKKKDYVKEMIKIAFAMIAVAVTVIAIMAAVSFLDNTQESGAASDYNKTITIE